MHCAYSCLTWKIRYDVTIYISGVTWKRELDWPVKRQSLSYPYRPRLLRFIAGCPEPFFLHLVHRVWHSWRTVSLIASLILLTLAMPLPALAWNIPGHMLSGAIAYQIFQQENLRTIRKGKSDVGETSLVREPMAGEAARCFCCRSWPGAVHAGGKVGR